MGLFDRFRKQPKVDPEVIKRNFIFIGDSYDW